MASLARRSQYNTNIWPGFVDALATLLMVIIFLLMIFVMAQFFLSDALSGRDQALDKLNSQISEMGDLLALERKDNDRLRTDFSQISEELQASVIVRDDLNASLRVMADKSQAAEALARNLSLKLDDAFKTIDVNKETIATKIGELAKLSEDINALTALREDLESKIGEMTAKLGDKDKQIADERKISESARAQIALANKQMAALRDQLAGLADALDASERKAKEQGVQISALGKRLNSALASKVQELTRYRSEFFGRLREVLGNQPGIRIVGDRFVFQSEVLFTSGSADLGEAGKKQLVYLATTLQELTGKIPKDIDWILRIDGHTDSVPIFNLKFPSNWELSSARAISVVKFLTENNIPANRLAAAGFGQYQPIDGAKDEIANRRNRRIELKLTQR